MKKKKSIKDIISYSEIKKGQLVGGILFVSLGMLLSICPILVIYKVIKSLFLYGKLEQSTIQFCIYGLAAVVLSYCLTYIGGILCHKFSYVLIANLKKKILFHIGNLPLGFFTGDNKSKIRQVLGSDMNQIEGYFSHQLPNLISTLALILAMIIVMLKINLILGLTTLLIIFVGLGIQIAIMAKIIKSGGLEKNFAILDQINSATTEYVKGMPEVKIFDAAGRHRRRPPAARQCGFPPAACCVPQAETAASSIYGRRRCAPPRAHAAETQTPSRQILHVSDARTQSARPSRRSGHPRCIRADRRTAHRAFCAADKCVHCADCGARHGRFPPWRAVFRRACPAWRRQPRPRARKRYRFPHRTGSTDCPSRAPRRSARKRGTRGCTPMRSCRTARAQSSPRARQTARGNAGRFPSPWPPKCLSRAKDAPENSPERQKPLPRTFPQSSAPLQGRSP